MGTVGVLIRDERTRRGMSQADAAAELGLGSQSGVSRWENGHEPPPIKHAPAIAAFLGIDVDDVILRIAKESPDAMWDRLAELEDRIAVIEDHMATVNAALDKLLDEHGRASHA